MRKPLLFILIFFFLSINGMPQQATGAFRVTGRVKVDQGIADSTRIILNCDGSHVKDVFLNRTGNFLFNLEIGHVYNFIFTKEGYYLKEIVVDTNVPGDVCDKNCEFPPYQMSVLLLKSVPGVKMTSVASRRISYNRSIDNFSVEGEQEGSNMQQLLRNAMNEIRDKSLQYEQHNLTIKRKNYLDLMQQGENSIKNRDYKQAMISFRDAARIFPFELEPRERVDYAFERMVMAELVETFGTPSETNSFKYVKYAREKYDEREYTVSKIAYEAIIALDPTNGPLLDAYKKACSEVDELKQLSVSEVMHRREQYAIRQQKYNELVEEANRTLISEKIPEAKELYATAASQVDENSYAVLMLKKIDELLCNDDMALQKARMVEEQEKEKIRQAREKAYNEAIAEADSLANARMYRDAIDYYELALTIKSYELYPRIQIKKLNEILAELRLKGEEYNTYVRQADDNFDRKMYSEARGLYVKAHASLPIENYALNQIRKIDQLQEHFDDQKKIDDAYAALITKADRFFNSANYDEALKAYREALKTKPDELYPVSQIDKIKALLDRKNEQQGESGQKESDYKKHIAQANSDFNDKKYKEARISYVKALTLFPDREYPQFQIEKIDKILNNTGTQPKKSVLDRIDFSKLGEISQAERQEAYNEAMQLGGAFLENGELSIARFYFRKALILFPKDIPAKNKIDEVELKMRGTGVNEAIYAEMVKKGDESFLSSDFTLSKYYYSKALDAKPGDEYAFSRLNVVIKLIETESQRTSDKEFEQAIANGDKALMQKNYTVARFYYNKAQSLKPDNKVVSQKISQLDSFMKNTRNSESLNKYNDLVSLGDQAFSKKQYTWARNYYRQALNLLPDEKYPLKQIALIDSLAQHQ